MYVQVDQIFAILVCTYLNDPSLASLSSASAQSETYLVSPLFCAVTSSSLSSHSYDFPSLLTYVYSFINSSSGLISD